MAHAYLPYLSFTAASTAISRVPAFDFPFSPSPLSITHVYPIPPIFFRPFPPHAECRPLALDSWSVPP